MYKKNITQGQILPIRRSMQKFNRKPLQTDSIKMCIVDKIDRTLKFPDSAKFIEVCRFLHENYGMEFYAEEDRDF